jgi:Spy/CpxP family protein refolding chaperone
MRKNHWKAVAVAAVLMMTMPALLALAADKTDKTKQDGKTTEQSMPGCNMHGGADKGADAGMPGCGMKGGKGKAGCSKSCDMKVCAVKGDKEMTVCVVAGGKGKGMPGCGMKGGKGKGMPGCGIKGAMGPGMADGPKCGPMLKTLDLTAEQQKKVDAIHEKLARQMVQAGADLRIAEMDMKQLMSAETPDKAKIDAQVDKVSQLQAGMQKSRIATLFEIRGLLTPEQLKKFSVGPLMGGGEEDD